MLRLDNAPKSKVRTDCFSASLWVCLASHTERCIVIVMYHFNRGNVLFIPALSFITDIDILYIVLAVI